MATKIEWTDETWNPITGCTKVSEGCRNCYAERMSKRLAGRFGYPTDEPFQVTLHPYRLDDPLRWRKPRQVFVCSMSDLFHDDIPPWFICEAWQVFRECPQHTFQILTKRPERAMGIITTYIASDQLGFDPLSNAWLGVSVENQQAADERIPILLQIPAAVRFVSCEPMLGPVTLREIQHNGEVEIDALTGNHGVYRPLSGQSSQKLDWVIVGGESGPGARPMHPDWARSLRDQCQAAGVPFFFKQWGAWKDIQYDKLDRDDVRVSPARGIIDRLPDPFSGDDSKNEFKRTVAMSRMGKKRAGRLLDGREWNEMPV